MFSTHSWSGAFSVSASHSHPKQESSPGLLNRMLTVKQGVALEKNWLVCVVGNSSSLGVETEVVSLNLTEASSFIR